MTKIDEERHSYCLCEHRNRTGIRQQKEDKRGRWHVHEIRRGSFVRTIPFVDKKVDADKVTTEYENGELKVLLPVHEAEQPKRISVKTSK